MTKYYKPNRISSIEIEDIDYNKVVPNKNNVDRLTKSIVGSRLKRTGPITIRQYKELFGEDILYIKDMRFFIVVSVSSSGKYKGKNIKEFKNELFMCRKSYQGKMKLYHNYTNIDNIIKLKERRNIPNAKILFDDEFMIRDEVSIFREVIKPDAVVFNSDILYFIETDLGTETYEILREKDTKYFNLIKTLHKEGEFKKFKVIFFTTKARLFNLIGRKVLKKLHDNNLIDYYSI